MVKAYQQALEERATEHHEKEHASPTQEPPELAEQSTETAQGSENSDDDGPAPGQMTLF